MNSKPFPAGLDLFPIVQTYRKVNENNTLFDISFNTCKTPMKYANFVKCSKAVSKYLETPSDESTFLKGIETYTTTNIPAPHYAIDIPISLFPSDCNTWNINKFTAASSIIHDTEYFDTLLGINTSYTYLGMDYTTFGFHIEDANLNSINYMHQGGSKSWTVVAYKNQQKLEAAIKKISPYQCPNILRHKHLIISHEFLKENDIPFTVVIQNPGEYIITESYR